MEKKTLYIDYSDDGAWIISNSKDFPYPRINVCGCPTRLFQEYSTKYNLVLSDAAALIVHHDLMNLSWIKQYFRAENYLKNQEQENQH